MGIAICLIFIVMLQLTIERIKQKKQIRDLRCQLNRMEVEVIRLGAKKEVDNEKIKVFDELCGGMKSCM